MWTSSLFLLRYNVQNVNFFFFQNVNLSFYTFPVYNSVVLSTPTALCNHHLGPFPELFRHPKEKLSPLNITPHFPLPLVVVTTHVLSVFVDWLILDISYRWNQTPHGLWCLASFTCHPVFKVHPGYNMYELHSFLWLNSICVDHILFIHPLMDIWIVSSIWLLWIMLLSTWVYRNLEVLLLVFLDVCWEVELLDRRVNSTFNFVRSRQAFPQWLHDFIFFSTAWGFRFLCVRLLDNHHPNGCEVVSHCASRLFYKHRCYPVPGSVWVFASCNTRLSYL